MKTPSNPTSFARRISSLSLSLSRSSSLLLSEMVPSIFRNAKACSKTRKSKVRGSTSNRTMVDADFKLKELKRAHKDLELKGKGYRKRLEELQTAICKHLEQYRKKVSFYNERVEELNSVTQERDDIKKQYDESRKKRC